MIAHLFRIIPVSLALAASSFGQAAVTASFRGLKLSDLGGLTIAPPDTDGAIGPSNYVEFINGRFAVYSRTGFRQSSVSDTSFWNSAGISSTFTNSGLTDPRVLFDPVSQRWFAVQITEKTTGNSVLVARTNGTDPAIGNWKAVSFVGDANFADFPTLGLDANGLYIGTNNFASSGPGTGVSFTSIPKADLLLATPSLANRTTIADSSYTHGFSLQGVTNFGAAPADGHGTVIAVDNTSSTKLDRSTIIGPASAGASLSGATRITVATGAPIPSLARQPDGTRVVDAGDQRIGATVVQVGSLIYSVRGLTVSDHAAIRLSVLNETTNALVAEGTISDAVHDLTFPSLAVNSFGTFVVGYTRSGADTTDANDDGFADGNLSAYASVGHLLGSTVTFDTSLLLAPGEADDYHLFGGTASDPERWGDYSATTLDPTNPNVFWTIQEYAVNAGAGTEWGTWIAAITTVPEPSSWLLLGSSVLAGAQIRFRRRRVET